MNDPIKVTKTVYTVLDFLNWQRDEQLHLRPYFQRGSVWTPKAKSFLIDTLIRGYPIPVIYLQNKTDAKSLRNVRQVVDGQQRLRTILSFIDSNCLPDRDASDDFTISRAHNKELAGAKFELLPPGIQERLTSTEISVHILPTALPDRLLLDLFARLNSTGERLNDQELRNAEFHGAFKSLAYDLANEYLDTWEEWRVFPTRAFPQMKHVEFTSELMLYLLTGLQAKSKASLDNGYRAYDDDFAYSDMLAEAFADCIQLIARATSPDSNGQLFKKILTQSWIYAIFAYVATSFLAAPLAGGAWRHDRPKLSVAELRRGLNRLESRLSGDEKLPENVEKALRGASSDFGSRISRFDFLRETIELS